MRQSSEVAIAVTIGVVALLAPILISVEISWKEAVADERSLALGYGNDVLRRTEEMAQQIGSGTKLINQAHNPPCSPAEIQLMRKVDVGSSYIQGVGRIVGDHIACTSLGTTDPISLGPPTLITDHGAAEHLHITLPLTDHPVDVFSQQGLAFILDPTLPLDIPAEGPSVSIAIFVPSSANHAIVAARGMQMPSDWFESIPKGSNATFRSSGSVVTVVRAANIDIAVITAAPESYAVNRARHFALIFVPLGLLCAIGLAWAVTHISRMYLSLPSVLRGAAKRREFFIEYQPIVDLESRRWIGAEALVRWQRNGQLVRPDNFIPTAEESGVITLITACVTRIVAADLPSFVKIDPNFLVAVNLSAADLRSAKTVELLKDVLRVSRARPANIKVEATERGFLQGEEARATLDAIHQLGIEIAIDDFGTGYSSLSCLQTLGIDALKIDRSFVENIGTDGATSNVVPHIISMAHSLKLIMVAEGVETEPQARFLTRRGVHYAQGWLFGRPMSLAAFCSALRARQSQSAEAAVEDAVSTQ